MIGECGLQPGYSCIEASATDQQLQPFQPQTMLQILRAMFVDVLSTAAAHYHDIYTVSVTL